MKSVIISSVCISAILFVLAIQSVINAKSVCEQELEDSLSVAVSQTMKEVMEQEHYGIENRNEWIAAFLQSMIIRTNSKTDLTVYVLCADEKKGIMDIEVEETFCLLNVIRKKISVRKTVIFEKKVNVRD